MNKATAFIEDHLTEEIDYLEISKIAYCSEYHFKRMFSFLAGLSLSEYIRRRKLTLFLAFYFQRQEVKMQSLKRIQG